MYKVIPGNHSYKISLNGKIERVDGLECTLPIADDKVQIELYGWNFKEI